MVRSKAPAVVGKFAASVSPATYALPDPSTAIAMPSSRFEPAEEGGVDEGGTGGIQLEDEGVVLIDAASRAGVDVEGSVEGAAGCRKVGRFGLAGHIRVAGRIDGDPASPVEVAAADERRIHESRSGRVQLADKDLQRVADRAGSPEGAGRRREIGRLRRADDIRIAVRIDLDAGRRFRNSTRRGTSSIRRPDR